MAFQVEALRAQFPILTRQVHSKPLIYLDSANTAQKPDVVIDAVDNFYRQHNANVARAVHQLSEEATQRYEQARERLAGLIGAAAQSIVLTSGTTAAINLVAHSFLGPTLQSGDVIVVSEMEHHANIVPWQLLCARTGATIRVWPVQDDGTLDIADLDGLLDARTKLLAVTHVSNVLGTINDIAAISAVAAARGVPVLVDGSQAIPHFSVDVPALGCDFYCFTGHKLFGPTGTGVLWAKDVHLQAMPPFLGGGEMIDAVSFTGTRYAPAPRRFEAGTPNIAGFIGLGAAVEWLHRQDREAMLAHEALLCDRLLNGLARIPGLRILGTSAQRVAVVSFVVEGAHAHDLAMLLDTEGIAIRSGHHCAHPLMQRFAVPATARVSLAPYNTVTEVDTFLAALQKQRTILAA